VPGRTITVQFVDASTGQCFARSDVPIEQLPGTFATGTTLTLAGESWSVLRAEPPTAAEFRASGLLVLKLSRVRSVSAHDILYSLPTLCDRLPAVGPAIAGLELLQLHEDEWRQVELISAGLADVVASEVAAVRRVYHEHAITGADGGLVGFRDLHIRSRPESPLTPPLPQETILRMLPAQQTFAGVGFADGVGIAVDSFACGYGPINCYGLAAGETITVLGLQIGRIPTGPASDTSALLEGVMRTFTLILADWCRCTVVDADSVGSYFEAIG
jgi:hypothetical protein